MTEIWFWYISNRDQSKNITFIGGTVWPNNHWPEIWGYHAIHNSVLYRWVIAKRLSTRLLILQCVFLVDGVWPQLLSRFRNAICHASGMQARVWLVCKHPSHLRMQLKVAVNKKYSEVSKNEEQWTRTKNRDRAEGLNWMRLIPGSNLCPKLSSMIWSSEDAVISNQSIYICGG